MSENAITRRSFLAGSAGAVALTAAAGYVGFNAWEQAHAEEAAQGGGETKTAHSLCNACSSKCGFTAYVVDGRLDKLIGDVSHPYAKGKLCARGYGYSQIAYSKDRLTDPLKKNDKGQFEVISWDQAFSEIADKVKAIIGSDGPEALAMVQDPRPSGKYYTKRFMHALGSANVYTHGAACNLSKESGFTQVIGTGNYSSDVANSKMTMFIGRSYADAIRPSSVASLQKAHEKGAHIVLVDPRCSNSRVFADEWVPINPGTDLALVLAMSYVLVTRGLYDEAYMRENTVGFDEWATSLAECTPEWAAGITGIDAGTIARLAVEFADAAPAASIEPSWRGAFGCSYANSGETARAICLFNTLLGCWNQKGGALFTSSVSAGKLTDERFADPKKPEAKIAGSAEYPLALSSMGTNLFAAQQAKEGAIKGMFFYNSNMAAGYSNTAYLAEALSNLDLCVVVDVQMSETAMLADYVLPDTSYLERLELPEFIGGKVPAVALRDRVLEKIHPNTKPVDEIFSGLAEACGVGEYFQFTVDELADAQLQTVGLSLNTLRQMGTASFPEKEFSYGNMPKWKTPTGKIQCTSEACEKAGLSPYPTWVAPAVMPMGNELRLIGGKQAIHSHTQTGNIEDLMQITKDYDLTRVWLNADMASRLGIADGDEVEVSNGEHTGRVRCKVTQRLNPTALYMPSHYGCSSPDQHTAYDVGLRQMDFVPFHLEPGYGAAMTQEAVVTVKKVGA
ncbi:MULTISPECIES: molybdopterin-containing oxidoreductase family protein [Gordonibacter]|uniref:Molybdopterin-dependent oxidoreductase n=1 Tax=Gordonibacter faecis TaxID=3047475 RepID=A0ABT7DP36_9ACTN|nr:molybdopterin-dependent oxidoreductase [Gordonibacter sp. KGMB12511]MDJ1651312.1 molybdopterin-dependent oxidoreductase [Gordonibacter sp. KGMB12511]